MAAVNTPAGTSNGLNAVRPIISATITSNAPIAADVGNKTPNDGPTIRRAICGAIKPTKPIAPAKEMALATRLALNNINKRRVFLDGLS